MTFTEDVLGMMPGSEDIHRDYIASKAPDAESIEEEVARVGVDEVDAKGTTIFPRTIDGSPALFDYQLKGWLKDAIGMLRNAGKAGERMGAACGKISSYKKKVDGLIFIEDRLNPFDMHGMLMGDTCARPLRAQTMQGERISIANSEVVPAGSTLEFTLTLLDPALWGAVEECLEYGKYRGLGQWRNSGKGRFTYEVLEVTETA